MACVKQFVRRNTPLAFTTALAGCDQLVLLYHLVSSEDVAHVKHLSRYRDERRFTHDIDALLKHFSPVTAPELRDAIAGGMRIRGKRRMLFTFDDGLRENHDVIAPLLEAKGIPAVFFLTTRCIDNRELMWRHKASLLVERSRRARVSETAKGRAMDMLKYEPSHPAGDLEEALLRVPYDRREDLDRVAEVLDVDVDEYLAHTRPYLTRAQISSLLRRGFDMGGHSLDHPHFDAIPMEEQVRQVLSSVRYVKRELGADNAYFALPFNDKEVSRALFARIAQEVDLSFDSAFLNPDGHYSDVHRVSMDSQGTVREMMSRAAVVALRRRRDAGRPARTDGPIQR
jgi:peptidoglycan/xylan/chitin deacetylase (PgdA/CDA1 family)